MVYRGLKLIPNIYENFIKNSKAHRFILSGRSFPFPMKPRCSGRRGFPLQSVTQNQVASSQNLQP